MHILTPSLLRQLSLLPDRLGYHMLLTLVALGIGILISIPLAIVAMRVRVLRGPLLGAAGVVQTIPSLALLALMVPLLGLIGFVPALIALILYSILPILRNTVTGIAGVDPALVEAARGVGMTPGQMLRKVQLPLAAPVILAGIRTSAVWVVGIATLSTPVGQPSLGDYIFQGLQLRNNMAILVGCAAAALLAIVLDGLIRALETAVAQRRRWLGAGALAVLALVGAGAVAPLLRPEPDAQIGAKTFTEQYILAEVMASQLRDAGFRPAKSQGMGSSILFDSVANGNIDCYVDYSGTLWTNVLKRADMLPPRQMLEQLTTALRERYGVECVGALGFENTYALAVPMAVAKKLHLRTIEDLAPYATSMRLGGDYEFFGRPEWRQVREKYGLRFKETVSLDSSLMYSALQEGQVDAIAAFSTDGRIAANNLRVLEDPRQALPPYDAVLLVSKQAAKRPGFIEALRPMIGTIDGDLMRAANKAADVDHRSPQVAAKLLLKAME
jgi:osmoprotectant transport system permease protein